MAKKFAKSSFFDYNISMRSHATSDIFAKLKTGGEYCLGSSDFLIKLPLKNPKTRQ
jgi:hypothetical protein